MDINNTLLDMTLKNMTWPETDKENGGSTVYQRIRTLNRNMIIVRIGFKTSEIEMTVLDSRTTLADKIAKFGGTFGLWTQLSGCSLLVLINVIVLVIKTFFKLCE